MLTYLSRQWIFIQSRDYKEDLLSTAEGYNWDDDLPQKALHSTIEGKARQQLHHFIKQKLKQKEIPTSDMLVYLRSVYSVSNTKVTLLNSLPNIFMIKTDTMEQYVDIMPMNIDSSFSKQKFPNKESWNLVAS